MDGNENILHWRQFERIALSKHKIKTFDESWTCATFKNVQHLKRSIQLIEIDIKPSIYFEQTIHFPAFELKLR